MVKNSTIILNRICIGDYLDEAENLGHEAINMFKPDEYNNYYVYLMSDGTYPSYRKDNNISAIYFTKAIDANCVEVVAVAFGIEKVFEPQKGFRCFRGGGGKTELDRLFKEILTMNKLKEINNEYNIAEINELIDWLDTESFLKKKPFNKEHLDKMKEKEDALRKLACNIEESSDTIKDNDKRKLLNDLCKAIHRRAAHIEQLIYIIENNVCYGGKRVDLLYQNNTSEEYGIAIYLTYKAEKIIKPSKPTYLVTDKKYIIDNKNADYVVIKRDRLATTTLASYFEKNGKITKKDKIEKDEEGKKQKIDLTQQEIDAAIDAEKKNFIILNEKAAEILNDGNLLSRYKSSNTSSGKPNFLSIIKKQYDELCFSNLFQYFFTHENYKKIFIDFMKKYGIELSDTYTIKREYKNIDLLVIDNKTNNIIVIENKIKSGINGIKLDEEGNVIETQLEKYKNIVEKDFEDKTPYFFIFKPDYNTVTNYNNAEYTTVLFSKLADSFEKGKEINSNPSDEVYFEDFIESLRFHSTKTDNHYEESIRQRMQQMIDF